MFFVASDKHEADLYILFFPIIKFIDAWGGVLLKGRRIMS